MKGCSLNKETSGVVFDGKLGFEAGAVNGGEWPFVCVCVTQTERCLMLLAARHTRSLLYVSLCATITPTMTTASYAHQ